MLGIKNPNTENIIRLFANEKLLTVQRQHWIVLFVPFFAQAITLIAVGVGVGLVFFYQLPWIFPTITIYLALLVICFLSMIGTFTFMDWYYQFYIITNKRVVHTRFFRVGGYYSEEILLDSSLEREVDRRSSNFIYDLLEIADVYIYFQRFDRPEPFTFKTPQDAQLIENILDEVLVKQKGKFIE